jgi:hypothetical protein
MPNQRPGPHTADEAATAKDAARASDASAHHATCANAMAGADDMAGAHAATREPAETAEAALVLSALGGQLDALRSAAVFFSGRGRLAVALAASHPNLRVSGFELGQNAVNSARQHALEANVGGRAVFARIDPRLGAYERYELVVVRHPVSGVADCEGALRAAARVSTVVAVLELPELAARVATSAAQLGLALRAASVARDRHVIQIFQTPNRSGPSHVVDATRAHRPP